MEKLDARHVPEDVVLELDIVELKCVRSIKCIELQYLFACTVTAKDYLGVEEDGDVLKVDDGEVLPLVELKCVGLIQ